MAWELCVSLAKNMAGELCSERLDFYRKEVVLMMTSDHLVSILNTLFEKKLYFSCWQTFVGCPKAMLSWLSVVEHNMPSFLSIDACINISSLSRVHIAPSALKHFLVVLISPWPLEIYMRCYVTHIQVYDYLFLVSCLFT